MTPTPPNTELAACPFCGAQAYLVKTQSLVQKSDYHPRTQANEQWTVGCGGENKCISHSQHVSRKDEVIAFWNTRPTISGELGVIIETVNKQAEDDGLWFCAKTAPEAYLQQELRKLHTVCEAALKNPSDAGGFEELADDAKDSRYSNEFIGMRFRSLLGKLNNG